MSRKMRPIKSYQAWPASPGNRAIGKVSPPSEADTNRSGMVFTCPPCSPYAESHMFSTFAPRWAPYSAVYHDSNVAIHEISVAAYRRYGPGRQQARRADQRHPNGLHSNALPADNHPHRSAKCAPLPDWLRSFDANDKYVSPTYAWSPCCCSPRPRSTKSRGKQGRRRC